MESPVRGVEIDDTHALMTRRTLDGLTRVGRMPPPGKSTGEAWVTARGNRLTLCWYEQVHSEQCAIRRRKVLIVEGS
jgi:hypothetical protein